MTGTTHALVGAAVGALVRHPGRALVGGIVSHAVLDCLPHRDYERSVGLALDIVGVLGVLWCGARTGRSEIVAGAIGGLLPDAENLIPCSVIRMPKFFPSHWFRHRDRVTERSEAIELATGALALYLLLVGLTAPKRPGRASGTRGEGIHGACGMDQFPDRFPGKAESGISEDRSGER